MRTLLPGNAPDHEAEAALPEGFEGEAFERGKFAAQAVDVRIECASVVVIFGAEGGAEVGTRDRATEIGEQPRDEAMFGGGERNVLSAQFQAERVQRNVRR